MHSEHHAFDEHRQIRLALHTEFQFRLNPRPRINRKSDRTRAANMRCDCAVARIARRYLEAHPVPSQPVRHVELPGVRNLRKRTRTPLDCDRIAVSRCVTRPFQKAKALIGDHVAIQAERFDLQPKACARFTAGAGVTRRLRPYDSGHGGRALSILQKRGDGISSRMVVPHLVQGEECCCGKCETHPSPWKQKRREREQCCHPRGPRHRDWPRLGKQDTCNGCNADAEQRLPEAE